MNLEEGTATVQRGKGGKRRVVGLDEGTVQLVRAWLEARSRVGCASDVLICTLKGERIDASYVRHLCKRLGRRAQINRRVHLHGLRHRFAVDLIQDGADLLTVQRLLVTHPQLPLPSTSVGLAPAKRWSSLVSGSGQQHDPLRAVRDALVRSSRMTAVHTHVHVRLRTGEETIELTPAESEAVLKRFPEALREARRWRAMVGHGALTLIDPELVKAALLLLGRDSD